MKNVRARVALALAAALVAGAGLNATQAEAGGPAKGVTPGGAADGTSLTANAAGAPSTYKTWTVKGGYTAAGVGLRNRGKGTIKITGIPTGAKVEAAYLFWSVLSGDTASSSLKKGKFRGNKITGTAIGSGTAPNWTPATTGYAYRADVTKWVKTKKNYSYALSGFASGATDGRDPFSTTTVAPAAEGASLVVVYSKSNYPTTKIVLNNGYGYVFGNTLSATMDFGFAASDPVGEVRTTFIGGDGQSDRSEPASTFNGVPLAGVDWDGKDSHSPNYANGNLWDTQTVRAVDLVKPGNTSATVQVSSGSSATSDDLIWVAQVLSIGKDGRKDTDGDKLLDGWEANGYDSNNNGVADVALPGASVVRKDLFVEMDWMVDPADGSNMLASAADLDRIVKVFATAPQANNPNGKTGIALHLDAGTARGDKYNLGGGNQVPFDDDLSTGEPNYDPLPEFNALRSANFNTARAKIFYYMIWANGYGGDTSSGNAFNLPNDRFVVTLGNFDQNGTPDQRVGTFIHEFGHTLGQKHGGDDHANYEPNYLSVMNYAFQFDGVQRTGSRAPYFGYSAKALPALNEKKLSEKKGLRTSYAKTYETRWACPDGTGAQSGRADRNIDWNCNGRISSSVKVNINFDFDENDRPYYSTLKSYNNWGHLIYGGGLIGQGASVQAQEKAPTDELTVEQYQKWQRR